jgi:hypothetical protein
MMKAEAYLAEHEASQVRSAEVPVGALEVS